VGEQVIDFLPYGLLRLVGVIATGPELVRWLSDDLERISSMMCATVRRMGDRAGLRVRRALRGAQAGNGGQVGAPVPARAQISMLGTKLGQKVESERAEKSEPLTYRLT